MTSKNPKAPVWGRALSPDARKQVEEAYGPPAYTLVELADLIEEVDKLFLSCLRKGRVPEGEDYCLIEYGKPLRACAGGWRGYQEVSAEQSSDTIKPVMRILYSVAAVLFAQIKDEQFYVDLMNALRFIRTDTPCANASGEAVVTTTFTWENRVCRDPFDPGADFNPCPVERIYDGPWEYMGRCREDGPRTMQLVDELHKMAAEAGRHSAAGQTVIPIRLSEFSNSGSKKLLKALIDTPSGVDKDSDLYGTRQPERLKARLRDKGLQRAADAIRGRGNIICVDEKIRLKAEK
ncbi:MAG TPA: hypothetical protein P5279_12915 [Anaerohalosphaeraceae bacterium]|nr:hypothetical protein [Anaerohalosphaeraceae bacterium]HRT51389.1 hypothetical protein [Anaerohalosphaeraceae bacterium]HRT87296.1 hypothetical protein [Anaerohalosphaeraceae bacterium]